MAALAFDVPAVSEAAPGRLWATVANHRDIQRARIALIQRNADPVLVEQLRLMENRLAARVKKMLAEHPLAPWLAEHPGLGGIQMARLIDILGEPFRFKGPRSLWHYLGLHVVDGHAARQQRGVRGDWHTLGRTCVMMPEGIADQIIRARIEPWRSVYDQTKERLARERGVVDGPENEGVIGAAQEGVEGKTVSDAFRGPLRPIQVHKIARTVAAKALLGDMLTEWKRRVEVIAVSDSHSGPSIVCSVNEHQTGGREGPGPERVGAFSYTTAVNEGVLVKQRGAGAAAPPIEARAALAQL